MQAKFLEAYNRLLTDKKRYIRACEIIRDTLADASAIDAELDDLLREKEVVEELTKKLLQENAFSADEPDGFQSKYDAYVERHKKLEARCSELLSQRDTRVKKAKSIERFTQALRRRKDVLTEFDNFLWLTTVDSATVRADGQITFLFRSGTEITV